MVGNCLSASTLIESLFPPHGLARIMPSPLIEPSPDLLIPMPRYGG